MAKTVKAGGKLIIVLCILLLITIGGIIYKSNKELDFNTIDSTNNVKTQTNTLVNNVNENVVVDSNIIE